MRKKTKLEATLTPTFEETAPAEGAGIAAEGFADLVRKHQRRILRILLMLVRDVDAAESLTQECFLRAYANSPGQRRALRCFAKNAVTCFSASVQASALPPVVAPRPLGALALFRSAT